MDVFLVRIIVHNGLAFYLTWLSLATILNFATYISYHLGARVDDASTIALFFIITLVVAYFVVENCVWQRFLLYVFTPWIVLIIAICGSMNKNYNSNNPSRNNIITAVLLAIILTLAVAKLIMFFLYKTICFYRYDKYRNNNENDF